MIFHGLTLADASDISIIIMYAHTMKGAYLILGMRLASRLLFFHSVSPEVPVSPIID